MHVLNPNCQSAKTNSFCHSQGACFRPYKAFKSLHAHLSTSFKISLLISQLGNTSTQISMSAVKFRKALTTSICLISRLNKAVRATASFYVIFLHTPANVWLQSFPYCCLNPLITYLAFYFRILLFLSLLVFKTSFFGSTLMFFNSFDCLRNF